MAIEALIGSLPSITPADAASPSAAPAEGFGASLERLVTSAEQTNAHANHAVSEMLEGNGDVHDAMIALQRAELTLQLTVQVRNKLVQAYQEIMRMPV
jgi:flagellar hook-basal body complex protein FliE